MKKLSSIDKRFLLLVSVLAVLALLTLGYYGYIMLPSNETAWDAAGRSQTLIQGAGRGRILDRNNRILAIETRIGRIAVVKDRPGTVTGNTEELRRKQQEELDRKRRDMLDELDRLSWKLAPILEIPAEDIRDRILNSSTNFYYIDKQVSIKTLETVEAMRDEVLRTKRSLTGLYLDKTKGTISIKKSEMKDKDRAGFCEIAAPLLDTTAGELKKLIDASRNWVDLRTRADPQLIDKFALMVYEADRMEKSVQRLRLERAQGRLYPEHSLAGQLIGFVGDDNYGLEGIEYAFESELAPPEGGGTGSSVVLTIDVNVQHILEDIAQRTLVGNKAEAVVFMAMDPRNGDILGAATLPASDPNNFASFEEEVRRNRPVTWAYEPGSVFKVFSLASFLDSRAIREDTIFTCNGYYERVTSRGERIVINCLGAHGKVTARDIIVYSCNAGAAYAADRMGADAFLEYLQRFGFGTQTGAGHAGETKGILHTVADWSDRSKPTIAMGQEISVSALQMLQAASAVANDGLLVPPRFVSRIEDADGTLIQNYESGPPRQILRAETARAMRSYMMSVTSNIGTGWRANVEDLSLAVKTGTAQSSGSNLRGYSNTDYIASCIALLPAEAPSLILYLVILRPQGESYLGGRIAAPPIREAAESLIDYLGIPRGRNLQISHSGAISLPERTLPEIKNLVPNFAGYSKRELAPLLLRDDLRVEISGEGWVKRQSPPPGTALSPGMTITLELD